MASKNKKIKDEEDNEEAIMKVFKMLDDDETGKITFKNLQRVADELGETLTKEELAEMIEEADKDGDGGVNRAEFVAIMKKTKLF